MTIVAMTREVGSLGTEVASGLACALGLRIVDSQIVQNRIAQRLGVDENAVQRVVAGGSSMYDRWKINRSKLGQYTIEEILELCLEDNVLVRGWGAAALFQDLPRVLSVRVCAPLVFREEILMKRNPTSDRAAINQEIQKYDAAYVNTMRGVFASDKEDALLYHIVINMARISVEDAVTAISALARGRAFQDKEALMTSISNKRLVLRAKALLDVRVSTSTTPDGVKIKADNGKLTLVATTTDGSLRGWADEILREIPGVMEIDNQIARVPPIFFGKRLN